MLKILKTALAAVPQKDWALVNHCLQQLPWEQKERTVSPLQASEWVEVLKIALQVLQEGDFQQKWEVEKIFSKIGKPAIAPLIEMLENENVDSEILWFVVRILSQFDDPAVILALVKFLKHTEDEELSVMVSRSLATIGKAAIEALTHLVAVEESRVMAIQALAQIRRPEIIDPLLAVVDDPLSEIRVTAIEALGSFHDVRIVPVLLKGLQDDAAVVRKEAVIALGLRADRRIQLNLVNRLKPLLYDLNPQVCQQAAIALGRVGTDEAAEALFPVLKSPATPIWLKLDIVRALGWIETVVSLDYLEKGLRWGDLEVCQEIIRVLGTQTLPDLKVKATNIIVDFFHSGQLAATQPQVKQGLAMSLGELGEALAQTLLQELVVDAEQTVRLHALAALKKFPNTHHSAFR
jgi:HEAT repeat protein